MAKHQGLSEKTLRKYHKMGLLIPNEVDEENGYRYYTMLQSFRLDVIEDLKAVGFSLAEIKSIICNTQNPALIETYDKQIEKLKADRIGIDNAIAFLNNYKKQITEKIKIQEGEVFVEHHKARCYLAFNLIDESYSLDDSARNAEVNLDLWERALRKIKKQFKEHHISTTKLSTVGCIIKKEHLIRHNNLIDEAFVFIDEKEAEQYPNEYIKYTPESDYMCVYINGVQFEDGGDKELYYLEYLMKYIEKNLYQIAGDYYGEVFLAMDNFSGAHRDMRVKLQIPVKK